jgi:hypothetical protein
MPFSKPVPGLWHRGLVIYIIEHRIRLQVSILNSHPNDRGIKGEGLKNP